MTRALLLDLDNTLIDRDAAVADWLARVVPSAAVDPLIELDGGGQGARRAFFAALARATGTSAPAARRAFVRALPALVSLKADADRLLRRFPGPAAIVSNGSGRLQREKIAAAGLTDRVAHVLISGELGVAKPGAAIFRQALARVGVAPAEALMIGDQPVADVAGARAVGIPAVLVRTRWHDPAEGGAPGAAIVSSLDEVTW